MVEIQTAPPVASAAATPSSSLGTHALVVPPTSIAIPQGGGVSRLRAQLTLDNFSPVNQDGCFEFDRVVKSGYVQKRTKTKAWKSTYLVMRPNTLSLYKSDKEDKLRHKIYLSELTAVTLLKDPKQKRQNVFGLFSPSKNFYFQAATATDAYDWVNLIRQDARIEEEEDEIFLASPAVRHLSCGLDTSLAHVVKPGGTATERERLASSSPEPQDPSASSANIAGLRCNTRIPPLAEYSGLSGNELASHSDLSDVDIPHLAIGASAESLKDQSPSSPQQQRPCLGIGNGSNASGFNLEQDPDRVIWQGQMWFLRAKGGLRQWKKSWAVLRPRNLILYRDSSEYSPHLVVPLASILNVVDIDPISRTKRHCLQIITEEKRFRFCARDEESLLQCLGAFKSLLAKRRELEARAAATAAASATAPMIIAADAVDFNPSMAAASAPAAAMEVTSGTPG